MVPRSVSTSWPPCLAPGGDSRLGVRAAARSRGAYQGKYDAEALAGWMGAFSTWMRQDKEVYCYFDNDQAGYAVQNALALQAMAEDNDGS